MFLLGFLYDYINLTVWKISKWSGIPWGDYLKPTFMRKFQHHIFLCLDSLVSLFSRIIASCATFGQQIQWVHESLRARRVKLAIKPPCPSSCIGDLMAVMEMPVSNLVSEGKCTKQLQISGFKDTSAGHLPVHLESTNFKDFNLRFSLLALGS